MFDFYNAVEGKIVDKVQELLQYGNVEIDFQMKTEQQHYIAMHRKDMLS